ncbi:MAG: LuxR C-terminal-related transcriptional regulator [Fuerstiella sp.]
MQLQSNRPSVTEYTSTARELNADFDDLSGNLAYWRQHLNQYHHPMVMLDSNFWPILLNQNLKTQLLDQTSAGDGESSNTAAIWQRAVHKAARHAADNSGRRLPLGFGEAIEVEGFRFLVLGSLLRSAAGRVVGAIINLTQVSQLNPDLRPGAVQPIVGGASDQAAADPEYRNWMQARQEARQKLECLTQRESEVVKLVAGGCSNKKIATQLGVTVKTIEKHRAHAILKLKMDNSAELIRLATIAGDQNDLGDDSKF